MASGIWIDKELSSKVLTIGCKYMPPRGGIAQVLWNYDNLIFEEFKFIENSRKSNVGINLIIALWALFKLFLKLLSDKKIKMLHIHTASEISFKRSTFFLMVGKLFGKKVVMHIHGGGFEKYYNAHKEFVIKNLKKCDKIISLSQDWVDFYSSIGFESACVENVIPEPILMQSNKADNLVHMLYLGLIVERKGIYDLLEVLSNHRQEFEGKVFLHIGGNGEVEKLLKMIKQNNLDSFVKFEGWVDNKKKVELLNLCDVFVLPSYIEGLPLSVVEALSYNMAVISTRVGGIPSIVRDDENGMLFNAGDTKGLYNALRALALDTDKLKRFQEAKNNDIDNFYPESVSKKLMAIYNSILLK